MGPVTVGRIADGSDLALDVTQTPSHLIAAGATRSGKSSLVYALLGGLRAARAPVRIVGIDPTGVLLAPVAKDPLTLITPQTDEIGGWCDAISTELAKRLRRLGAEGVDRWPTADTQRKTLLVCIEEWQALMNTLEIADRALKPADRAKPKLLATVDSLLAGGAKVQMKVLLITQRASVSVLPGDSRANFSTRICMRVDDDESMPMLLPGITSEDIREAQQSFAPGDGYVRLPGAIHQRFRSDHVTYEQYREVMK